MVKRLELWCLKHGEERRKGFDDGEDGKMAL